MAVCWGFSYQKTDGLIYFSSAILLFPQILTKMTGLDLLWARKLAVETDFFPPSSSELVLWLYHLLLASWGLGVCKLPLGAVADTGVEGGGHGISLPPSGSRESSSGLAQGTAVALSRDGVCLWVCVGLGVFVSLITHPACTFPFSEMTKEPLFEWHGVVELGRSCASSSDLATTPPVPRTLVLAADGTQRLIRVCFPSWQMEACWICAFIPGSVTLDGAQLPGTEGNPGLTRAEGSEN